ncbi:polysaccharide biosynthesis/export family protein [Ensifer sp. Root423]|uniref:polysaccharide biosynthesis/export family protein n=1 Tax=Ensifer sp. Root423 TaxID=1736534 RepID=UPI0007C8BE91|nr:polysaccharide biosynthesis/export family protein [Ensifer sp. Root423]
MRFPAQSMLQFARHLFSILLAAFALAIPTFAVGAMAQAGSAGYQLSPGDVLSFDILDDAELPVSLTIGADGAAAFPFIGAVKIEGQTISGAIKTLHDEFLARQVLKNPKLSLSVATYRPVFVVGVVRAPGSFPYYPGLIVEQAVGLAGGAQSAATNPADRIIALAKLRGSLDETDVEIVREGIYTARLYAQLRGSDKVDLTDLPQSVKKYIDNAAIASIISLEEKILKTDLVSTMNQSEILKQGVTQTEASLVILGKLKEQQEEVVALNEQEVVRTITLRKRELNTESQLSRVKTATSNEKSRLLEIYAEIGRQNRELGNLKLQLATLQANREKEILTLLQEREATLKKLETVRRTTEEQYLLLAAADTDTQKQNEISFVYEIRRGPVKARTSIKASALTDVLPGDVIVVSIAGM